MTGAVLAGGRAARMGTNKALLELGGIRIIERLVRALRPLFSELAIVANEPETYAYLDLPIWPDRIPGKGPLGGLYTAVLCSAFPRTFCIACDMPFPDPGVIAYLQRLAPEADVVVPRTQDAYQPLHAIYGKTCLPTMERLLRTDRLKIDQLFSAVRLRVVEGEELRRIDPLQRAFVNINTEEDLAAAARLARSTR